MNRFRIAVACALAVLLGAGAVHAQPGATRISVLPLSNSGDKNADYFADALTDEIAVALTKVPGVGVVGRSSVYISRLPGQVTCPQRPDAEYLVSGSANRAGQNIRISVRLERQNCGGTSAPLWQADYERSSNDLFDIEEDIALHVAEAVGRPVRLARGEHLLKSRAKDMEAYDQYLHAKVLARGRGAQALGDASKLLEQVLARDPDFEPAAAMIAYEYALTPLFAPPLRSGHPDEERKITDRLMPRAEAFALRAVALDPKDATAFVGLGYVRLVQRKMIAAEDAFKEALRLDPNQADGLHGYSQ